MVVLGLIHLNTGFQFYPLPNIEKLINIILDLFPLPLFLSSQTQHKMIRKAKIGKTMIH
jgi:hypothetical protein